VTADDVIQRFHARPTRRGFSARCPSHDDHHHSLSLAIGRDGRVLVHCFVGCQPEAIVRAVGLELRDLFGDTPAGPRAPDPVPRRSRLEAARHEVLRTAPAPEVIDAYRWADEVRACYAVVRQARALATALGPESERAWQLLDEASRLETATRAAEVDHDP
jgi:hypothetical protein